MTTPLPSISTLTPGPPEPVSQIPCSICRRQFSKYTCPRCNAPYCSLICFRSGSHMDCSESFYRDELETDIRSAPSKTAEERTHMLELLKRFEDGAGTAGDGDGLLGGSEGDEHEDDEDEEGDDLAKRLSSLDLASASVESIWELLTPTERQKFLAAVRDPEGELAQQLLASEELEGTRSDPWWQNPITELEEFEDESDGVTASATSPIASTSRANPRKLPEMLKLPSSMIGATSDADTDAGVRLLYNFCAICLSYAFTVRRLATSLLASDSQSLDADRTEARRIMVTLSPFIADKRSTTVHTTLDNVVQDFWARADEAKLGPVTQPLIALLLRDTASLMRPSLVSVLSQKEEEVEPLVADLASDVHKTSYAPLSDHPNRTLLLAFSDLHTLFLRPAAGGQAGNAETAASRKLAYYAARVLAVPSEIMHVLCGELQVKADRSDNDRLEQATKGAAE